MKRILISFLILLCGFCITTGGVCLFTGCSTVQEEPNYNEGNTDEKEPSTEDDKPTVDENDNEINDESNFNFSVHLLERTSSTKTYTGASCYAPGATQAPEFDMHWCDENGTAQTWGNAPSCTAAKGWTVQYGGSSDTKAYNLGSFSYSYTAGMPRRFAKAMLYYKEYMTGYTYCGLTSSSANSYAISSSTTTTYYLYQSTYATSQPSNSSCKDYVTGTYYFVFRKNYNITYSANGGSGGPSNTSVMAGRTFYLSNTQPTRTGYTFSGWYYNGTTYNPGTYFNESWSNTNMTFSAQWTVNSYSVSFEPNGGTRGIDANFNSVSHVSGYSFNLNSNGYYESSNKGVDNSYALCKVMFSGVSGAKVNFEVINYAESNWDFAIFSDINATLSSDNSEDTTNVYRSFKGSSYSTVQNVSYTLPGTGGYFITIKFRKDGSTHQNNDSVQFRMNSFPTSVPSYSVFNVDGYAFTLNSNGYYESQNKGVQNSYALCRVRLRGDAGSSITFEVINYAEANYDYALFSNIDTVLSSSNAADTTGVYKSFYGQSSPTPQKVTYTLSNSGTQNIYIKFRKDSSGDHYNDSVQFRIISSTCKDVNYNSKYGILPTFTKDHYDLIGWYTKNGTSTGDWGTKIEESSIMNTAADTTLYAKWEIQKQTFQVYYHTRNVSTYTNLQISASSGTVSPSIISYGANSYVTAPYSSSTITVTIKTTNSDYYISIGNAPSTSSPLNSTTWTWKPLSNGYINVYVYQRYTISFDANGGSGSVPGTIYKIHGTNASIPNTQPTKAGYIFDGWNTNSSGTGATYTTVYTSNSTTTLYAKWVPNTYSVSFDTNGGSIIPNSSTQKNLFNAKDFKNYYDNFYYNQYGNQSHKVDIISDTASPSVGFGAPVGYNWSLNDGRGDYHVYNPNLPYGTYSISYYGYSDEIQAGQSTTSIMPYSKTGSYLGSNLAVDSTERKFYISSFTVDENFAGFVLTYNYGHYTVFEEINLVSTGNETIKVTFDSTYGALPSASRSGCDFLGWSYVDEVIYDEIKWNVGSSSNYSYTHLLENLNPGATYNITIDSAKLTKGSATQFTTLIYDFTINTTLYYVANTFGNNVKYRVTCPASADSTHDLKILMYAGLSGATAGNSVEYLGVEISSDVINSSTQVRTARSHTLYAKWSTSGNVLKYDSNEKYFYFEDGEYPQSEANKVKLTALPGIYSGVNVSYDGQNDCYTLNGTYADSLVQYIAVSDNLYVKSGVNVKMRAEYISGSVSGTGRVIFGWHLFDKNGTYQQVSSGEPNISQNSSITSDTVASTFENAYFKVFLWRNTDVAGSIAFTNAKFRIIMEYDISSELEKLKTPTYELSYNDGTSNIDTKIPVYTYTDGNKYARVSSQKDNDKEWVGTGSNFYTLSQSYKYTDKITVNLWGYMDNWAEYGNQDMRLISCTETGGWSFYSYNGFISCEIYDSGVGYKSIVTSKKFDNLDVNQWHMFTLAFDGQYAKIYVDGVYGGATEIFQSGKIGYNENNTIFVGAEAGGNANSPYGCYFKGKIKNIQIRNMSLSGENVKELYNTGSFGAWFKVEPIRWRVSDYGVSKTQYPSGWTEYGAYNTNFTAVSDKVLWFGAVNSTAKEEEWFSSYSLYNNVESNSKTLADKNLLKYYSRSSPVNVDGYNPKNSQTKTKRTTITYSSGFTVASINNIDHYLTDRKAKATDLVKFFFGTPDETIDYWTSSMAYSGDNGVENCNLGNVYAITKAGTMQAQWLNKMKGVRFAITFTDGHRV